MTGMATDKAVGVSFEAVLEKAATGNATGIVVPTAVIEQLAGGKKPPVHVTFNKHAYHITIGAMNGNAMIPVSAEVCKEQLDRGNEQLDRNNEQLDRDNEQLDRNNEQLDRDNEQLDRNDEQSLSCCTSEVLNVSRIRREHNIARSRKIHNA